MNNTDNQPTYAQAITELEKILTEMQNGDCDIDRLSESTSRALKLLKFCKDKLHKTDEELKRSLEEFS